MEILIIILLVIIIGIEGYKFMKKSEKTTDDKIITILEKKMYYQGEATQNNLKNVTDTIDKKVLNQNLLLEDKIERTIKQFENKMMQQNQINNNQIEKVIEKMMTLDNNQNQILQINDNITSLKQILNDKQARGAFGEIRLEQLLESNFGINTNAFQKQVVLPNNKRADFVLKGVVNMKDTIIDSKFPLENYSNYVNASKENESKYLKQFEKDVKKHVDDIANKYIIESQTTNYAIMFIPSETIYYEILATLPKLITYGYEKKVWITSPTTIMVLLNLLTTLLKDIRRDENVKEMHQQLLKLKTEFKRYEKRFDDTAKHSETLLKDLQALAITSKKITKQFDKIEDANFEKLNENDDH